MTRPIHSLVPSFVVGLLFAANAPAAAALSKDQVKAKLEEAGYTNVTDIRREKDHFEAKAMKDGQRMTLDFDANTGAITPENGRKKTRSIKPQFDQY